MAAGHALPAALAGAAAWRLQPWVRRGAGLGRAVRHALLGVGFGAFWAGGIALLARAFSPEALPMLVSEVLFWTGASGALLYLAIAAASASLSLRERLAERGEAAARAELAALRARLEPHFLHNALESVAALVGSDPEAAEEALARLGTALRRLHEDDARGDERGAEADGPDASLVSLAAELECVRDTLWIERLRMGERLRTVERIDPAALDLGVPAFTLQPLVDNAVRHGLSARPEGGTLALVARLDAGALVLEVSDDGVGADDARLGGGGPDAGRRDGRIGLGLAQLERRLRLRFGERAGVDAAGSPGRGVSVRVTLPAVEVA